MSSTREATSTSALTQQSSQSPGESRRDDSHDVRSNSHLDVPVFHQPPTRRRSSLDSTFTDLSDLTYMSNDHASLPLMRSVSNASNCSAYSTSGPTSTRQKLVNLYHQNYGAFLVLLSQFFGSGMNVATSLLEKPGVHGPPMHPFQILLTRQFLTALLCAVYALTTKSIPYYPLGPPDRTVRLLLVCRGVFGFFGVFGMYFSLLYLPLSEATVLTFLAPILTCYACSLLMPGERFTRQQQLAGCVSLIGVVFIAHPTTLFASSTPPPSNVVDGISPGTNATFSASIDVSSTDYDPAHPTPSQHLFAIAIAMVGVLGSTIAMTCIRAIGTRAHAFISVNYFSVWSSIVSTIAIIVLPDVSFRLPSNLIEWALLLSLGICGFIMQALLTMGLAYGGPKSIDQTLDGALTTPSTHTSAHLISSGKNKDKATTTAIEEDIEMQPHNPASALSPLSPVEPEPSSSSSLLASPPNQLDDNNNNDHPLPPRSPRHHRKLTTKSSKKSITAPSGNRATSMVYCQMLFALAADKIIFGTTLSIWSWIGSGLILTGAIWVAAAKDGNSHSTKKTPSSSSSSSSSTVRLRDEEQNLPTDATSRK